MPVWQGREGRVRAGGKRTGFLYRLVRKGLHWKVICEQRPKGSKNKNNKGIKRKKVQGPKAGKLFCSFSQTARMPG